MARAHVGSQVRLLGVTGRKRSDLLISTALQATTLLVLALPAAAQPAPNARPTGGSVVAGSATISQSVSPTTIDQTSQRAAINWQSFNVGAQQSVTFQQPSSSAVALNRVTGPDPSQIAGRIDANGQVVLVNQAGVTFYKGAQVNAQGLIVTSSNVSDANFMAGKLAFDQAGNANASVTNQGTITVKQAGLAALVAPRVANSGVINAQMGHVVLAGAKTATLDLYGDGLLSLDVSNQVTQAPIGPGGKQVTALVTNSGVIRADGGTVQLTATAADGVIQHLVQAGGTLQANSVGARIGTVVVAGTGGSVTVTGLVSADGLAAGTTGGQIEVNATGNVTLGSKAQVTASGASGGGTVAIGTTLRRAIGGPGTVARRTAANVVVRPGAHVTANATTNGDGGRVTVLSTNNTTMAGSIAATGGGQSGDGGFVEVSGDNLTMSGLLNVSAPHGKLGTILFDPDDLTIIQATPGSLDNELIADGELPFDAANAAPPPNTLSSTVISQIASEGNIIIQAKGTIDIQTSMTLSGGGITIQAGTNLTLEHGAGLVALTNIVLQAGAISPSGALILNDSVESFTGPIQLIAGTGGIALNANLFGTTVDLISTGGVSQAIGTGITATSLISSLGVTGNVSLLGNFNQIQNLGGFTVTPDSSGHGDFQMADAAPLAVSGIVSTPGGNVYLHDTNGQGIFILSSSGVTTGSGNTASFHTDEFANGGVVTTGTFELAPSTLGQGVVLGPGSPIGLALPSLSGINASLVRIGAVTLPGASGATTTAGGIVIEGPFDGANGALELDTTGLVNGGAAPLINVGTLSGTAKVWSLPASNSISSLGDITGGGFSLVDTVPLTVNGTVSIGVGAVIADTGLLSIDGCIEAATVLLSADSINIAGLVNSSGFVSLVANIGTISETGTLIADTLTGTAVGAIDLLGAGPGINQVGTLGPPDSDAGSFALRDGIGLTVAGSVVATSPTGQVFLGSTDPAGITIAATGAARADAAGGTVSLQTDLLLNSGAVVANTIQLAPATGGGTVTLGASGSGLSLPSMAGLTATNLVIGAVTQPSAGAPTTSAGGIAIGGPFTFVATGSLTLDASSTSGQGATGAVTQSAPLTDAAVLSGNANNFALTNSGNAIAILVNLAASSGDLDVTSAVQLFPDGVSAAGNAYLSSPSAGGVLLEGPVSASGRVGVVANAFGLQGGNVYANTFELAPFNGGGIALGSSAGGLSLLSLSGITATTVRLGAVTPVGGISPLTSAGAVTVVGPFNATGATILELDAVGAITQSAALTNVATLAANGSSVVLANLGNLIGAGSGITATVGNIVLVDGESLALSGAYSGNNLFFEVAAHGGNLTVGGGSPATLSAASGALISLVADGISANTTGSIGNAGGTVELAPFSSVNVSLAGSGGAGTTISGALLSSINVGTGTLLVGGYTNLPAGGSTLTTTAGAISLDGPVNLAGRAGTLVLLASGTVTESGGPLSVGTVTGVSVGDFSLGNPANQIQASTGVAASNGNVVLATDPILTLTGTYKGDNLLFEVTAPGGSLVLGNASTPATLLAASGGRVSLVADGITATAASTITAPAGTVELAPFSSINESVLGTNTTGQLLIGPGVLADISVGANAPNTLVIGGFTTPPSQSGSGPAGPSSALAATSPTASAGGVTLDGTLNMTGLAPNLELLSLGSVTQPGGPLTVTDVFGTSATNFALTNPANAIANSLGITASNGDVMLVNGGNLALQGQHAGNNLFFEVAAQGGTLSVGTTLSAELTAVSGGRVSLVADHLSENASSSVTAPAGTLELAPFSAVNVSLFGGATAGPFRVDPTMLSIVTPGLGTLVVGGFTNEPAGGTSATPSASSLSVDGTVTLAPFASGLNLLATGPVTQAAPLLNVATLAATGGGVTLANPGNLIAAGAGITASAGNIVLVDGESLALNGSYKGDNLFFEVALKGGTLTVGGSAPASLSAASGGLIAFVADGISANTSGSIGNAGGTVELAPFSPVNVSLGGTSGTGMPISESLLSDINVGGGTLVVGGFSNLPAGGSTIMTTAGSISLDGVVNLAGRAGTLELLANGAVTEPGGPLTVGTVTGVAAGLASLSATGVASGDFSLNNLANQIQASTGITASNGNIVLAGDPPMTLTGTYTGNNLFFEVTLAGGGLVLGNANTPATLLAASGGRISLLADGITATAASAIIAPNGTVELAPYSAIKESVLGTNATGQLLIDATLLEDIASGTNALGALVIGGYTSLLNGTVRSVTSGTPPTASASGVTIDSALNLTGKAADLTLLANGSVTEPGGPVTVAFVSGNSVGNFSLTNPANAIAQVIINAASGDIVVVDSINLAVISAQAGGNLFFEVATPGGALSLGGTLSSQFHHVDFTNPPFTLTAGSAGRITLVADQITEVTPAFGANTLTAPGGTLELAPFSPINESVAGTNGSGQLLIDTALFSYISPSLATLELGGFTNEPTGATSATASAASISINGTLNLASLATTLNLQAIGGVTQTAPILNVGTLTGNTGSTTLSNSNNSIGIVSNYGASGSLALSNAGNLQIAGTVTAGSSANFSVNGTLTETGGITASQLSGSAIGTASLNGNNIVAELDGFVVGGGSSSLSFNPNGNNLLIGGTVSANRIVVSAPSNQITLGNGASIVTGGNIRPTGTIAPVALLPVNGAPGAYFQAANFTQSGHSSVSGLGGGPATLQISVTGDVQFDPRSGLAANNGWLILNLTTGTATGNVSVKALDVSYTPLMSTTGTVTAAGSANLTGSVAGAFGPTAAGLSFIQPALNPHYLFNNCEIGSSACLISASDFLARLQSETTVFVPLASLLALVTPALVVEPEDNDNLLEMPVVSKEDY